ncbi:MAG TPA: hypothetical protein VGB53_02315 [Rubricoccaceae bacterium]|jgi:hypothetical protein
MLQTAPSADTTIALFDTSAAQALTVQSESPSERAMLAENKLPVVLAVVLIVWAALMLLALRTDRRLARIERALDAHDSSSR